MYFRCAKQCLVNSIRLKFEMAIICVRRRGKGITGTEMEVENERDQIEGRDETAFVVY